MQPFKLVIQEPCQENWNNMSAQEKGRFCAVCEKTVVDFTNKSPLEIKEHIDKSAGKVCGRVNTQVLQQTIVPQAAGISFKGRTKWWTWLSILAMLGFTRKISTMDFKSSDKKPNNDSKKLSHKANKTIVHGTVRDNGSLEGIGEVGIKIYSGGELIAETKSYINGAFELTLPKGAVKLNKVNLEFAGSNYESTTLNDIPVVKNEVMLDVKMNKGLVIINELIELFPEEMSVMMGGIGYNTYEYTEQKIEHKPNYHTMGGVGYRITEYIDPVYEEVKVKEEEIVPVDVKEFSLKTYPNPTADFITVEFDNAEQVSVQVFDMSGKLMHSITTTQTRNTISLADFPNGTYIVRAIDDASHKVITNKVVKVR